MKEENACRLLEIGWVMGQWTGLGTHVAVSVGLSGDILMGFFYQHLRISLIVGAKSLRLSRSSESTPSSRKLCTLTPTLCLYRPLIPFRVRATNQRDRIF